MATQASRSNFYFVNPSEPLGTRDAYEGNSPSSAFVRTSWEWMWERYLRRKAVLTAAGRPDATDLLLARKGACSMWRQVVPPASAAGSGSVELRHVVRPMMSDYHVLGTPPGSSSGSPYSAALVELDPPLLSEFVAKMALDARVGSRFAVGNSTFGSDSWFSLPTPVSGDPHGRHADGSLAMATSYRRVSESGTAPQGSELPQDDPGDFCDTEMTPSPLSPWSFLPVFRLLADRRTDDRPLEMAVPVWDGASGSYVERTAWFAKVPDATTPDYDSVHGAFGKLVNQAKDGGAVVSEIPYLRLTGVSSMTASLAFPFDPGMDFSPSSRPSSWIGGAGAYSRFGKTGFDSPRGNAVGGWFDPPAPARGGVGLPETRPTRVMPSPDWDGEPSCWAMWGFPHIPQRLSGTPFGRQLAAFCRAQPAPPPLIASRLSSGYGMPSADEPETGGRPYAYLVFGSEGAVRRYPVSCACEASETSAMLDRLGSTVSEVPDAVFASHVSRSASRFQVRWDSSTSTDSRGTETYLTDGDVTTEYGGEGAYFGSLGELVRWVIDNGAVAAECPDTRVWHAEVHHPERPNEVLDSFSDDTVELRQAECVADGLTVLRPGVSNPGVYLGDTTVTTSVWRGDDPGTTVRKQEYAGSDADGWEPAASDLFLHPDVAAWAASPPVLYAVVDVTLCPDRGDADGVRETFRRDYDNRTDPAWSRDETSGSGSTAGYRRVSVHRLGTVDPETGELAGALDVAALARSSLPPDARPAGMYAKDERQTQTEHTYRGYGWREETSDRGTMHELQALSVRLFLAVDWDFDTLSPPEPKGQMSACARLQRRVSGLRGRLESARSRGEALDSALSSAASRDTALSALSGTLSAALADGESAYADAVADAQDAVDDAADAVARKRAALEEARRALASAAAENWQALRQAERDASSDLSAAEDAYMEAMRTLDDIVSAQSATAQEAQEAIDGLSDAVSALSSACGAAGSPPSGGSAGSGAAGAAASALSDASSALSAAESAVGRPCSGSAESAVEAFASAVGAAEAAVAAYATAVEGTADSGGYMSGGVLAALAAAEAAAQLARRKVWAAVRPA